LSRRFKIVNDVLQTRPEDQRLLKSARDNNNRKRWYSRNTGSTTRFREEIKNIDFEIKNIENADLDCLPYMDSMRLGLKAMSRR